MAFYSNTLNIFNFTFKDLYIDSNNELLLKTEKYFNIRKSLFNNVKYLFNTHLFAIKL